MNDKEQKILEVAIGVICRYGVRKATMGDIASAAGISRQTLYASYASKEEILAAVIQYSTEKTLAAVEADWAGDGTIGDKLDSYFQHCVVVYYDLLSQMPDSEDIQSGFNEAGMAEQERAAETKKEKLAALLAPYAAQLGAAGLEPGELADLIQSSSANFKYVARNREHLMALTGSLKKTVLSLIGEA